jgi:hypothetical protein
MRQKDVRKDQPIMCLSTMYWAIIGIITEKNLYTVGLAELTTNIAKIMSP